MRNVYCVGRNYLDHVKEGYQATGKDLELPEVPQFFTKATHAVNAPDGDVRLDPGVTRRFDYEVELAVIIGRPGRDIAKERALEHVFGYAVANDFTARDLQRRHQQWFKGKSLDTTFPFGPWIVDAQEIGDPGSLELSLSVNGEERQRATGKSDDLRHPDADRVALGGIDARSRRHPLDRHAGRRRLRHGPASLPARRGCRGVVDRPDRDAAKPNRRGPAQGVNW